MSLTIHDRPLVSAAAAGIVVYCASTIGCAWIWMYAHADIHASTSLADLALGLLGYKLHTEIFGVVYNPPPGLGEWVVTWPPAMLAGIAAGIAAWLNRDPTADRHVRGRRYLTGRSALRAFRHLCQHERRKGDAGLKINPVLPPISEDRETRHFLVVGGVGAGKTQVLRPVLEAARARGDSLLINDNKGDFWESLPALPGQNLLMLAPWDRRGARWDIAADICDSASARIFAQSFIPDPKTAGGNGAFFQQGARQVMVAKLEQFQTQKPGRWTLADLLKAITVPLCDLMASLETTETTDPDADSWNQRLAVMSVGTGNQAAGVIGTVAAGIAPLVELARSERGKPANAQKFSVRSWLQDFDTRPTTLVLVGNDTYKSMMAGFSRAITELMANLISSPHIVAENSVRVRRGLPPRRLWFFLDEFPTMGPMPQVRNVIEVGRSKGIRVVLGVQDLSQLADLYGRDSATAWQQSIHSQIICQINPGETAEALSKYIGEREFQRYTQTNAAPNTRGGSWQWMNQTSRVVMPAQLAEDLAKTKTGVRFLFLAPGAALRLDIPFWSPPPVRPVAEMAQWTKLPPARPAIEAYLSEERAKPKPPAPAPQAPGASAAEIQQEPAPEDEDQRDQRDRAADAEPNEPAQATQPAPRIQAQGQAAPPARKVEEGIAGEVAKLLVSPLLGELGHAAEILGDVEEATEEDGGKEPEPMGDMQADQGQGQEPRDDQNEAARPRLRLKRAQELDQDRDTDIGMGM